MENLFGGTSTDTFIFGDPASLSGNLSDLGGVDTLDYSSRTAGVTVDLGNGTATAIGATAFAIPPAGGLTQGSRARAI